MQQYVIIGAGQAGSCAAFALRQAGFAGRILLLGEEEWLPYERPPLSKETLTGKLAEPKLFAAAGRYREKGIEFLPSTRVEAIGRTGKVHLRNGKSLAYDRLLIATGGRPRRLNVPGSEHIQYLRTFADAWALHSRLRQARRMVCIGGGVIGLEIAASAALMGVDVVVIETTAQIMNRCLAPPQAAFLHRMHETRGVQFRLSSAVVSVQSMSDGRVAAHLDSGDIEVADIIIAGIGMERASELAGNAGLAVDNGILVDLEARSSDAAIFAAGDVAAFMHARAPGRMRLESWYHAQYHGACAGRAMAGSGRPYDDIPRYWTDQYDLNIQVAGFPAAATVTELHGSPDAKQFTALHYDNGARLIGVTAVNEPRSIRPNLEIMRRNGFAAPPGPPAVGAAASA